MEKNANSWSSFCLPATVTTHYLGLVIRLVLDRSPDEQSFRGSFSYVGEYKKDIFTVKLDYRRADPSSLFFSRHIQLAFRGVGLASGLCGHFFETGHCFFEIGRVGGILVSEDRNDQRSHTDQEGKPLIGSETGKKIMGWAFAGLATCFGAIAGVCLMGAVDVHVFRLSRRSRVWNSISAVVFAGLAFWILDQLAAPLLR